MSFHPQESDLKHLFSASKIEVPPYQRSYSWRKSHVETLWTDISDYFQEYSRQSLEARSPAYFLGTIVFITKTQRVDLLLDGQQRLATLAIFLSVLRHAVEKFQDANSVAIAHDIEELLYSRPGRKEQQTRLSLNTEDRHYFELVLSADPSNLPDANSNSHKLLKGTKELLSDLLTDHLSKLSKSGRPQELGRLTDILQYHLKFLTITVTDEQEACDIFEHLNNRGIALGLADLLRNMLFKKTPSPKHRELSEEWETLLRLFPEGQISDCIRYSWISRRRRVSRNKIYDVISHEIKPDKVSAYLSQLKKDAIAYHTIIDPPKIPLNPGKRALLAFQTLGVRQCLPLLIAVQESVPSIFAKVLTLINRFSFSFSTVCNKNPNVLERTYCELARFTRAHKEQPDQILKEILVKLRELEPAKTEFIERFSEFTTGRASLQKYILSELEHSIAKRTESRVGDADEVWVEHIYPQTPKKRISAHGEWVNRIGNLTLLRDSVNRSISNKDFEHKLAIYAQSELKVTNMIAQAKPSRWNTTAIADRQRGFAKVAASIWLLPQEAPKAK